MAAARAVGQKIDVLNASSEHEIDTAFASLVQRGDDESAGARGSTAAGADIPADAKGSRSRSLAKAGLARCAGPDGPVEHDCTHAIGYGICFFRVGASESAGRPQRCFASRAPQGEIGHARQPVEVNAT
jgi:hypothetical protein